MLLTYGTYSFPENETEIGVVSRESLRGKFGQRTGYRERWQVKTRLSGADSAAITSAIQSLEASLLDGYSLTLYTDSGTTSSAHALANNTTLGGVKVASIVYPDGRGAEYSTFRNVVVEFEAEVLTSLGGLVEFDDNLEFIGGGPRFEFIETLAGPPVKVLAAQQTTYKGMQSGNAVGIGGYPGIPAPVFPEHEHISRRRIRKGSPQYDNGGQWAFPVSWSYEFEASQPLPFIIPSPPAI